MVCPLHIYYFLVRFGLIDIATDPVTIIYDEIDLYYKQIALDQFHRFYSKSMCNLTTKNTIFVSATM